MSEDRYAIGRRAAALSIGLSAVLAVSKIVIGILARSTSVMADGFESAGDVLTSSIVFIGLLIGPRPADKEHPYGHGRAESIAGLIVGVLLATTGAAIAWTSLQQVKLVHEPPKLFGLWPLLVSLVVKIGLSIYKFRVGRRVGSSALIADAWNDSVDILSGFSALTALGLTLADPVRFIAADHFGGFAIGCIVVSTGFRVTRDSSMELMDTMPSADFIERVIHSALNVEGVHAVEKCWARKSGLSYHIDIHVEVDPLLSVRDSHTIAHRLKDAIMREHLDVAHVLVHIEPAGGVNKNEYC